MTLRGAGLGNEIFPWAKAYLGAKALGLTLVEPPWRTNPRGYHPQLGGNLGSATSYYSLAHLPSINVDRKAVEQIGRRDYYDTLLALRSSVDRSNRPTLLHSSGMMGGYLGIKRSRPFLRNRLLGTCNAISALEKLEEDRPEAVRIGVHVRGTDFTNVDQILPSEFNQAIPLEWYKALVTTLHHRLGGNAVFYVTTDAPSQRLLDDLSTEEIIPKAAANDPLGDLAVLASCDLIISSISSFSLLAIFLGDGNYVWHRDQLGEQGGWLSIWGHENFEHGGGSTKSAIKSRETNPMRIQRGLAQGGTPRWTDHFIRALEEKAMLRARASDLIYYGVIDDQ
ncbi:hypothetical protein [Arthrobacter sp. H5]|uniref:hypothetical protein n=1 Tax=Arthrobacter sp. H5 TaxID=1267973 RepID=UPI0012DE59DC|nr:hypothetical protein [Arthrobacter sp. H5]